MNVSVLLSYLLPPILGAAIGCVTNAIAIRMLFRPYREWRVFSIRVPFTPGIIPRRREDFAESIGRMVSDELLTEESVAHQISGSAFRTKIEQSLGDVVDSLLQHPLHVEFSPDPGGADGFSLVREVVASVVSNSYFRAILNGFFGKAFESLGKRTIGELFSTDEGTAAEKLAEYLDSWLSAPARVEEAKARVRVWLREAVGKDMELRSLERENLGEAVSAIVSGLYVPFVDLLLQWSGSGSVRVHLERQGRFLLRDILDRLTLMQKLFFTAAQYDKQIEAQMPGIVDDALKAVATLLGEEESRVKLCELVRRKVESFGSGGVAEAPGTEGKDPAVGLSRIIDGVLDLVFTAPFLRVFRSAVRILLEPLELKPISEILDSFTTIERLSSDLTRVICARLTDLVDARHYSSTGMTLEFGSQDSDSFGDLLSLDEEMKIRLNRWLAGRVISLIRGRIPAILASINVRALVVDKINGLEVDQVEGLLMRVIHRHLKWINVFGALLGFLIGALQVVLRLITSG